MVQIRISGAARPCPDHMRQPLLLEARRSVQPARWLVIQIRTAYRPTFATVTSATNTTSRSRRIPAAIVNGSPMMGAQLNRRDQRPKRWYQLRARSSDSGLTGNQARSRYRSMARPRNQFTIEPSTFPVLATISSSQAEWPASSSPTNAASDCSGKIVAAAKAVKKRPAYRSTSVSTDGV